MILEPHLIEDFENESFSMEPINWSSYAYRITAARNLERILQSNHIVFTDDPAIYRLETLLANWQLHLPQNKRDFIDPFGSTDEMLFQARMIADV